MRVYIEQTQQKKILKFVCDEVITSGSIELSPSDDLSSSPLAEQLFQYPFVQRVYITANFVAIQRTEDVEWEDIAQSLKEIVNEYLENDKIILKVKETIPYTLYAEMTPNPNVMRFVANQAISDKMVEVKSREEAGKVPVAEALFNEFDFVGEVFFSENYFSVTRNTEVDWTQAALQIRQFLLDYLKSGKTLVFDDYKIQTNPIEKELQTKVYSNIEEEIQKILKEYIQPAVASDGGNIALVEYKEDTKTAVMLLQGACSGCPSSTITLKNGIETMLKDMLPNVVENVEAING